MGKEKEHKIIVKDKIVKSSDEEEKRIEEWIQRYDTNVKRVRKRIHKKGSIQKGRNERRKKKKHKIVRR